MAAHAHRPQRRRAAARPRHGATGVRLRAGRTARTIGFFLVLTVVDAALVVVTPLLVKAIIDDGILKQDSRLVVLLALAVAGVAVVDAGLAPRRWAGSPRGSGRG